MMSDEPLITVAQELLQARQRIRELEGLYISIRKGISNQTIQNMSVHIVMEPEKLPATIGQRME